MSLCFLYGKISFFMKENIGNERRFELFCRCGDILILNYGGNMKICINQIDFNDKLKVNMHENHVLKNVC